MVATATGDKWRKGGYYAALADSEEDKRTISSIDSDGHMPSDETIQNPLCVPDVDIQDDTPPNDSDDPISDNTNDAGSHRYFFQGTGWSSAHRFRNSERYDELRDKLHSRLHQFGLKRQSARVHFLQLLRHLSPGINLRSVPRWVRQEACLRRHLQAAADDNDANLGPRSKLPLRAV